MPSPLLAAPASSTVLDEAQPHHYRADIDGLRAVAVLAVIMYHAFLGCPGGFVGVDIFYVISGFLISSIILNEIRSNTFSLPRFWERRIRRILPASTAMTLVSVGIAWFVFMPSDFDSLGRSVVCQAALVSNVFFWRHAGYFAPAMNTKPLLHTWSLSIEEQFYLLFPLLLVFLVRSKRLSLVASIVWLTVLSFLLCVVATYSSYDRSAFFLLPTRAWELLVGVLLTAIHGRVSVSKAVREACGWAGLALCGYAIFAFSSTTAFPGAAAALPCVGAGLIIFSSESQPSHVGRLLSWRPLVGIGMISYSLYLWHWPLLIYSSYVHVGPTSALFRIGLLAIIFVVSFFSWKYVETPFRSRRICPRRPHVFWFGGGSFAVCIAIGLLLWRSQGMPSRLSPQALAYDAGRMNYSTWELHEVTVKDALDGRFYELGPSNATEATSVLLWGDSHAKAITPAFEFLCNKHALRGFSVTHAATAPVLGYVSPFEPSLRGDSPVVADAVVRFVAKHKIKTVILAARWPSYPPADALNRQLVETVRVLTDLKATVYVLKEVPFPDFDVPRLAAIRSMRGSNPNELGITRETYEQRNRSLQQAYSQVEQAGGVLLDPTPYFLNQNGLLNAVRNDQLLYADDMHLTVAGAMLLTPLFEPIFKSQL